MHGEQVGQILKRFEAKGFKLVALKAHTAPKPLLERHYDDLKKKPFFQGLVEYMSSGPVVCMVWEGLNAVRSASIVFCDEESASFFVPTKHRSKRGA